MISDYQLANVRLPSLTVGSHAYHLHMRSHSGCSSCVDCKNQGRAGTEITMCGQESKFYTRVTLHRGVTFYLRELQKSMPNGRHALLFRLNMILTTSSGIRPIGTRQTKNLSGHSARTQRKKNLPGMTRRLTSTPRRKNSTWKLRQMAVLGHKK